MKRAYKLQEFVAHTSHVNCLKIGRKSAGVLVTGGEDKKVNVWAIGKPTPVLVSSGDFVRKGSIEMTTGLHIDGMLCSAEPVGTSECSGVCLL